MYESEVESDEDNEVYFLKPVNEYNIAEKIKEANKQLFSELKELESVSKIVASGEDSPESSQLLNKEDCNGGGNRKVTFALVLESYGPEDACAKSDENADEDDLENSSERNEIGSYSLDSNKDNNKNSKDSDYRKDKRTFIKKSNFPKIEEESEEKVNSLIETEMSQRKGEEENLEVPVEEEIEFNDFQSCEKQTESEKTLKENGKQEVSKIIDDEEPIIEEICEEILTVDFEPDSTDQGNQSTLSESSTFSASSSFSQPNSSQILQRRNTIIKQETFDFFDDYVHENDNDDDNKSLTNLLHNSDDEEDHELFKSSKTKYKSKDLNYNDNADMGLLQNTSFSDDEVDTDDISIIVASYIPDDFNYAPLKMKNKNKTYSASTSSLNKSSGFTKNQNKKHSNFSKHFSFRRKAVSSHSIGNSASVYWHNAKKHNNNNDDEDDANTDSDEDNETNPYDIKNLKLNYKTCCEYRNGLVEKLPKYTGYLSEYGLSEEQLLQRNEKLKKKQHFVIQQTLRAQENELRKMEDNERAFTTWLKNKMRFPINRTRNMFDMNKNKNRSSTSSSSSYNPRKSKENL